jgi:uncharacterized protein YggE
MIWLARVLLGATAWLVVTYGGSAEEATTAKSVPNLLITGEGSIRAAPDSAVFFAGVTSTSQTAREALNSNRAAVRTVIASAKSGGVADADIQTSDLSLQPQRDPAARTPDARIIGYQVVNRVVLRIRNLNQIGNLIDDLVTAGCNQLYGLRFEISEPEKYLEQARRDAVTDARKKAELYAHAAGVRLGRLLSLVEDQPPLSAMRALPRAEAAAASQVPIERGESEIKVQIRTAWELLAP